MSKRTFRIGELADHLRLERFVIRFWEKEFGVRTKRSYGGQRYYDEKDLNKFETIKRLLYNEGYTIAGAKKYLKDMKGKATTSQPDQKIIASQVTTLEPQAPAPTAPAPELPQDISQQILALHEKLRRLRDLL